MTFAVTYRGKDGMLREEPVEAAGRAECFAQCRARGIVPTGVRERKGGGMKRRDAVSPSGGEARSPGVPPKERSAPVAAMVVLAVLLGGIAWWWFGGRGATDKPPARAKKADIQERVRPAEKPTTPTADTKKHIPVAEKPKQKNPNTDAREHIASGPPPGTVLSVRTNDNNLVITEVVGPDGKKKLLTTELRKPIVTTPADQLILTVLNTPMSGQMAPLPIGPEADVYFRAAMKRPILDDPDDTEEVKRMKQVMRETREEIARLMEQGQTFAEILEQHRELWNENVRIREGVVAEYRKIVKAGNEKDAKSYMERMNAALGQMGIPPLTESDGHSKKRKRK